jgi:hypothetical protein
MDEIKSQSAAVSRPPCGDDTAGRAYAVVHDALKAYDEHWSYLTDKAKAAGASINDVRSANEYDFAETVKSIAWSYFLYEVQHYFRGNPGPEPYITKDIVSTLKKEDKATRRRFLDTVWDSKAALEGLPLIKYLDQSQCGPALKNFFISHFAEGKKLLCECLAPLAKCAHGVEGHEYRRIIRLELWKKVKEGFVQIVNIVIMIGILALVEIYHIPPYIFVAGLFVFLVVLYVIKKEKKTLYYICTFIGYMVFIYLLRLLPSDIGITLGVLSIIAYWVIIYLIERKKKR